MSLKTDINMCRICMKTDDVMLSIYSKSATIKKIQFCTQLEILRSDDLPKTICNKCVGRLEIAYDFRKQAEYSDTYLRQFITHKEELNQSVLAKEGLYDEKVLEIHHTRIKAEQDDQIEQLTDFGSEEVSTVKFPPTLEDINCQETERLTDSVPVYAEIEEADIGKIQETKQINLFTIEKITSIPKTEFNQTNEITGNGSSSQEDIEPVSYDTQIKVEQDDQMKQPTDVKSVKISEAIEEGNQNEGSTCGADIAKIEKLQETKFTIAKVTTLHKNEDDQTGNVSFPVIHTAEKPFTCIACDARFTRNGNLKRHLLIHSGERPSEGSHKIRYTCIVCGEHFTQKGSLKRHSLVHSAERPYKCKICGQCFTQSNALTAHFRIHSGDRPFKCKICGESFTQSNCLTSHMAKHTEEKPYTCVVCDASFKRKESLKRHSQIHSGERPYKCDLCGRGFNQSNNLVSHKRRRHTGGKPYPCETCGLHFKYKKALTRHVFIKHENQKVILNKL